jgi:hypothetical protein
MKIRAQKKKHIRKENKEGKSEPKEERGERRVNDKYLLVEIVSMPVYVTENEHFHIDTF